MTWKTISSFDLEEWIVVREQLHQATQSIAAVGRHFLKHSEEDENAVLSWRAGDQSLVGKTVAAPSGEVLVGINFEQLRLLVEGQGQNIATQEITGSTFAQLMMWLEGQLGQLGLPIEKFSANLPYEIPAYPTQKGESFSIKPSDTLTQFGRLYYNTFITLENLRSNFSDVGEVTVWPHHFDQAISVKLKNSGTPDTSTYLGLGMSPGDEHYNEPYFYVNSWPYAEESKLKDLPHGHWHSENWVGAVLRVSELWSMSSQNLAVEDFFKGAAGQLQSLLLE